MLLDVKNMFGYSILAVDGGIGTVRDFYFDQEGWTIRYLVVDAGNWLAGRKVLISPASVQAVDPQAGAIQVELTVEQVRSSPPVDKARPISRALEIEHQRHYDWPPYWEGAGARGISGVPEGGRPYTLSDTPPVDISAGETPKRTEAEPEPVEGHLHSVEELRGYRVWARHEDAGDIAGFLVDDRTWEIRYLVVDTTRWWPGGEVILKPEGVKSFIWTEKAAVVDLSREAIKNSPEYDPKRLRKE